MTTEDDKFTLPNMLRQPLSEVRRLQDTLLKRMIELCYDHHPFYGRLMRREGLRPEHITNCAELVRLPTSTKKDFLDNPDDFRLRPEALRGNEGTLWKVVYTTGTSSGRPAPIYITAYDHLAYLYLFKDRQDLIGLRSTDVIANLFPMTGFPLGAYSRGADEAAAVGAAIIFGNTGRTDMPFPVNRTIDEAIDAIVRHRATVIWGIPGFVRRVLSRAQERNADFSNLRMIMMTGEASSIAMREDFKRRMRNLGCADSVIINRYGSTEQGGNMIECCEGSGFHSSAPDQVFHEIIEENTGRRLADGETGMLALTHLNRRGSVFLRYEVGDVGSLDHSPCPHCGRTSVRLSSNPVRTGDIIKIRGVLVNLGNLKDEFDRMEGVEEYQIVIRPDDEADTYSKEELVLRLSLSGKEDDLRLEAVREKVKRLTNLVPAIELVDRNEIFDPVTMTKAKRIVDLRRAR